MTPLRGTLNHMTTEANFANGKPRKKPKVFRWQEPVTVLAFIVAPARGVHGPGQLEPQAVIASRLGYVRVVAITDLKVEATR